MHPERPRLPARIQAVQIAVDPKLRQENDPMPPAEPRKKDQGQSFWNNPLTATAIVVVSAVVVGIAIDGLSDDDDEAPASAQQ